MKFLGELAVFVLILALSTGVVFALLLAGGSVLHVRTSQTALLAFIAVFFWIPAFANVHLALRPGPAPRRARVAAACRALGMLQCSAAMGACFLFAGVSVGLAFSIFVAGLILNVGTLAFES